MRLRTVLFIGVVALQMGSPAALASPKPALTAVEKDRLRWKLETLFNEQDLLIRNQKVDRSDIRHQVKEFEALKVFERIPFKEDIAGLKTSLATTSKERGLELVSFKPLPRARKAPKAVPSALYTDQDPGFRLSDEQLAEEIPFRAVVRGDAAKVRAWVLAWPEEQMRLAEPEGRSVDKSIRKLGPDRWEVKAHAFRFRDIKFPALKARDPLELLPAWARRNPDRFAAAEPLLWRFVERTHGISPEAGPLYRNREEMLLNSARLSYFIARAVPRN
jgi:hypothetical protein